MVGVDDGVLVGVEVGADGTIVNVVVAVMPLVCPVAEMVSGVSVLTLVVGTSMVVVKSPFELAFTVPVVLSNVQRTGSAL